jgi:hypothetical protein
MRSIIAGISIFLGVGAPACDRSIPDRLGKARLTVDQLAFRDAPQWAVASQKECPDSLLDVLRFVGKDKPDTIDPWGTPYELFCKQDLPSGASGLFAAMSYGPDKKKDTEDDIASWQPRR